MRSVDSNPYEPTRQEAQGAEAFFKCKCQGHGQGQEASRPWPAGNLGNCNDKLVTNRLGISFQESVILCGFLCTSVSAPSKNSGLSMGIYQAIKELKVQLIRGQQSMDAGFVRGCGTRCTHIKPVENLADQSASIKASSTEHTSDVTQFHLPTVNFGSSKCILKDKRCFKILGAAMVSCPVEVDKSHKTPSRCAQDFQASQKQNQHACESTPRGRQPP